MSRVYAKSHSKMTHRCTRDDEAVRFVFKNAEFGLF